MADFESIPYRIRIGVTGHRKLDDPAAVQALVKKAIDAEVEELFPEESSRKIESVRLDLICFVTFDKPPLTRRERAENVCKRDVFTKYGPQARAVLEALLQKYQDQGVMDLSDPRVLQIPPFDTMGRPMQLIKQFGTRADFMFAVNELRLQLGDILMVRSNGSLDLVGRPALVEANAVGLLLCWLPCAG